MIDKSPLSTEIEDARLFSVRLEVIDCPERRAASLDELAPLLALFARARVRQESEKQEVIMT